MRDTGHIGRAGTVLLALLFSLGAAGSVRAEVVDRIVAVVGSQIILLSEVDEEVYLGRLRNEVDLADPDAVKDYRSKVLEGKIEEKILVEKARREGIRLERAEIDAAVDRMVDDIRERFPTEDAFLDQLDREGMTVEELRATYRPRVEEQLLVRQVMDRLVRGRAEVSEREIKTYWDENAGDIPPIPAALELRRVLIRIQAGGVDETATERAEHVLRRAMAGEDFATLATIFSEGPAAKRGGDLGWFRPEDLEPRLAAAVSPLGAGEISDVVVTNRGAHILKVDEIRDTGERHLRQIVFLRDEEADRARARARAESVLRRLQAGEDFATVAAEASDDTVTRASGGYLGKVPVEALAPEFRSRLENLAPGELSPIVEDAEGFSIFRVDSREGERVATFEEIHDRIAQLLEQKKAQEIYRDVVKEARETVYIENRLDRES